MSDKGTASQRRSTGLLPAGIIIAVLIAVAAFITLRSGTPLDDVEVTSVVTPAAPEASETESAPAATDAPTADTSGAEDGATISPSDVSAREEVAVKAPTVDEVRVDGAGTMVVAGRGDPGSEVDVLLDGEVVTSTEVDGSGSFAALTTIPESADARSLTLRSGEGEETIASEEEIILAPLDPTPAHTTDAPSVTADAGTTVADALADEAQQNGSETAQAAASELETAAVTGLAVTPADDGRPKNDPAEPADSDQTVIASEKNEPVQEAAAPRETEASDPIAPGEGTVVADDQSAEEPALAEADLGQQIAVLRSDELGVTLVQPAAPLPDSVVLDTIGYNDEGVVQLAGRASGAATQVRIYLNNRPVARLEVSAEGVWRGAVPDVAPGVYRLRIDALTIEGRVASRIETPFKREAPAVLAAAAAESSAAGPVRAVTVQAGDTLWAIARERYGEGLLFVQVFEANRDAIRDPDLIYPGQVFELPDD